MITFLLAISFISFHVTFGLCCDYDRELNLFLFLISFAYFINELSLFLHDLWNFINELFEECLFTFHKIFFSLCRKQNKYNNNNNKYTINTSMRFVYSKSSTYINNRVKSIFSRTNLNIYIIYICIANNVYVARNECAVA